MESGGDFEMENNLENRGKDANADNVTEEESAGANETYKGSGIQEISNEQEAQKEFYDAAIDVPDEECDCEVPAGTVMRRYELWSGEAEYIKTTKPIVFKINRRHESNRDNNRLATFRGRTYHVLGKLRANIDGQYYY